MECDVVMIVEHFEVLPHSLGAGKNRNPPLAGTGGIYDSRDESQT